MKKLTLTIILAAVAISAAAQDFDSLFGNFAKQADTEYQSFQDDANKAFLDLLKESWVEFQVFAGLEYPKKPKPKTPPVAPVAPVVPVQPEVTTPVQIEPEPEPVSEPEKSERTCSFTFYGSQLDFIIPEAMADYKMSGNSEDEVAKFWDSLSSEDYRSVLSQINEYASRMQLEGWSLFLLIDHLAGVLYGPSRADESEVFKIFMMNQLGMDARLGLADGKLTANVCVKEQVYASLFYQYQGRNYYFSPSIRQVEHFKSYSG